MSGCQEGEVEGEAGGEAGGKAGREAGRGTGRVEVEAARGECGKEEEGGRSAA